MRVRHGLHLWPRVVHLGVNHEAGLVDHGLVAALDDVPVAVHQNEVGRLDEGEVHGERVEPKVVRQDRVWFFVLA